MELRNEWQKPPTFIAYGAEAKARDFFLMATACFDRLELAADPAESANLKQTAHLYLKEAVALLSARPSTPLNSATAD
jgi:hypothetical protein